jgi:hypothetical protein
MSCNNRGWSNVGGESTNRRGCGCGCGNVGGTSRGGCGDVGCTSTGERSEVGGTSMHERKCCVCFLVEPITNFLRCLCGRGCHRR